MRKLVSILNPWMGVYFAICVALQWNDPDPYSWMPMYGAAMIACILTSLGRLRPWISIAVGLVALVWAIALAPSVFGHASFSSMFQSMKASNPEIEISREMYGLLIVVVWMAALTLAARRRGSAAKE
jgi:hypothetical protein